MECAFDAGYSPTAKRLELPRRLHDAENVFVHDASQIALLVIVVRPSRTADGIMRGPTRFSAPGEEVCVDPAQHAGSLVHDFQFSHVGMPHFSGCHVGEAQGNTIETAEEA